MIYRLRREQFFISIAALICPISPLLEIHTLVALFITRALLQGLPQARKLNLNRSRCVAGFESLRTGKELPDSGHAGRNNTAEHFHLSAVLLDHRYQITGEGILTSKEEHSRLSKLGRKDGSAARYDNTD